MTPSLFKYNRDYNYSFYGKIKKELQSVKFEEIGEGCSRIGYRRGNVVVKVPINTYGIKYSIAEAFGYRKFRNNPDSKERIYAPCRLLPSGCLMMVYVNGECYNGLPRWALNIDGAQAGTYKGRIVAYDMSHDTVDNVLEDSKLWDNKSHHDLFHSDV
ncbi:MAG TPA: hypothetical protein VII94_03445 [Candidatus Saccharimonadales bacterium]